MKILCLIPARSGSKGVPNKNIKLLGNKPLLAWSIEQALASKRVANMRIIVSTDSEEYQKIAQKWGAEVPFLRPAKISQDLSTDYEFIKHALDWLELNENYIPDIILQLRPTQPCRKVEDIDKCLDIFIKNISEYDSLRSVIEFEKSPYKMYTIDDNILIPLYREVEGIKEPYNECRQKLPKTYLHNGYIDIFKTSIFKDKTISGHKIYPYLMNKFDTIDIDTLDDWNKCEKILNLS
jgi:CMP-N-acetylneuraminic acid synthetase